MDYEAATRGRIESDRREAEDLPFVHGSANKNVPITLAATFTVDPLQSPLEFWMDALGIPPQISLAPYAQVMQELLSPESLFARNRSGFNVLLVRLEDWIRGRSTGSADDNLAHIGAVIDELVAAIEVMRARTSAPLLTVFSSESLSLPGIYRERFREIQVEAAARVRRIAHVYAWDHSDVIRLYPAKECIDPRSDEIANIPYTAEYFLAIATFLARRIAALVKPQYKVIAVDCDNTLWGGVCGEDGAEGVQLTPEHIAFQELLVRQHDEGMLLCLCTKNNPSDVDAVFLARPEMPLRQEHLVCSRVNWQAKSGNLQSIAKELGLSLDSFIFVDDSAMECAEVRSRLPSVLTLNFPQAPTRIRHFMDHVWAFDRVGLTSEAKQRTEKYKQNRLRSQALQAAPDLERFLASLELRVVIAPMVVSELTRVAELVQRTNQFNLTTIRRRASEIEALVDSLELQCLTVHVQDRFGDYGLVGVVLFRRQRSELEVDTFLLSCRVLGRGVEHQLIKELASIALQEGKSALLLKFRQSSRNEPGRDFLEKLFVQFEVDVIGDDSTGERRFIVPTEYAMNLPRESKAHTAGSEAGEGNPDSSPSIAKVSVSSEWHDFAYNFSQFPDIVSEFTRRRSSRQDRGPRPVPHTSAEAAVAGIFAEVLGIQEEAVDGDFFDLGGNSVQAVQVLSRVSSTLGLELSLHEFLEAPTVAEIASRVAGTMQASSTIQRAGRVGPLPVSLSQHRLWFLDQLEGGSAPYDIPLVIRLRGHLDRSLLSKALDAIVDRHELLRTVFVAENGDPVQQIAPAGKFSLQLVDLRPQAAEEREAEILRQLREEQSMPFDLSTGPLIRGRLLQLSEGEHALVIIMNHVVSDGWSVRILIEELGAFYQSYLKAEPVSLPNLSIQYADYAVWQRESLKGIALQEGIQFWKQHLQGAPELLELPTDHPRPAVQSYRGASVRFSLGPQLVSKLRDLSRQCNMTLAMTSQAAWSILLSRLSGQKDVVLGIPVANRRRVELEGLIGFFVDTLAVRVRLENNRSVFELLQHVKKTMLSAYEHQEVPFEKVVEALQPPRGLSHSPVFQVMLAWQNVPRSALQLPGLIVEEEQVLERAAKFDLTLELQESNDGIDGLLNYSSDLFDVETIERWVQCYESILKGMVSNPEWAINSLSLMTEDGRRQVIEQFNRTGAIHPDEKTIHQLFEEQVERTPREVAVICEDQELSYAELNARANQLAHYLRNVGVSEDQVVAICVERSLEMVVGLLGILKAGGAYLPLDPRYPSDRIDYMLKDAAPLVLLTQRRLREGLANTESKVVLLDSDWGQIAQHRSENLTCEAPSLASENLAYVIYTSGSTGKPKGVMIEHRNVVSLWRGLEGIYSQFASCQHVAVNASFNFDASVKQFVQLLSGRSIVLIPEEVRLDASSMVGFLRSHQIDCIDCTPSQLKAWIAAGLLQRSRSGVRLVLVGGEPIDGDLWNTLVNCSGIEFYNVYGPTESTVDATFVRLKGHASAPHIGYPMKSREIYILDDCGQPVPIGVNGEMYIGGAGVARGYLNRPKLTAERFIPNPFSGGPQMRLYKTGDLGRWRADGSIEFHGRNDNQVKIRGVRVELGEIEAQLTAHMQVKEAVVLPRDDGAGERRLVAYVVLEEQLDIATPIAEILRGYLRAVLPEYMVPSAFVTLDFMPLTANGKLDMQALPTPMVEAHKNARFDAPSGEVEEALALIWRTLLRIERIGRQDNFFDLGGHSLLVLNALFEVNARFGSTLKVTDVYRNPTLQELAARISGESNQDEPVELLREATLDTDIVAKSGFRRTAAKTVLLTGGTGFVGRFLLAQLLHDTDATIYCLVRAQSVQQAEARLKEMLLTWDLWRDGFERRVIATPGDLRLPRLGLDDTTYAVLSRNIDSIYHCATSMNHLETYAMAKSANVDAVREILKLATEYHSKLINYVSTLSIFTPSSLSRIVTEETSIEHEMHRNSNGYVASKWVAEKIFMIAAERGIPCNIFRLGLIWADSQQGRYDELQRVYRVIKSCLISGIGIENYRSEMPPTPVDYAAHAVVVLAERCRDGGGVFHISSSEQKVNGVFERCNDVVGTSLRLLPYYDWIQEMKRLHHRGHSLPAMPLIEFAFSMDEREFHEWQRNSRPASVRFDLSRTHGELEHAGIIAPVLDDDLLRICVENMVLRDVELRAAVGRRLSVARSREVELGIED